MSKKIIGLVLILIFAGAWVTYSYFIGTGLRRTTSPQTVEFYMNATPYTGGPSYQMFDIRTKEPVLWSDGNQVTLSSDAVKKIEEKAVNAEFRQKSAPMYRVKAKVKITKIQDSNTSIPVPDTTITYYMADVIEVYSATGV